MPSKTFGDESLPDRPDPITFTVAGRGFRCVDTPPASLAVTLDNLPDTAATEDDVRKLIHAAVLFVAQCVDDHDAWLGLVASGAVGDDVIADVFAWLCSEYAQRLRTAAADVIPAPVERPPIEQPTTTVDEIVDLVLGGVGEIGEQH